MRVRDNRFEMDNESEMRHTFVMRFISVMRHGCVMYLISVTAARYHENEMRNDIVMDLPLWIFLRKVYIPLALRY